MTLTMKTARLITPLAASALLTGTVVCCMAHAALAGSAKPHAQKRVTKGCSFLCAENYRLNYRPSARRGTDYDTGMSHPGFRCVLSPEQRDQTTTEKPKTEQ